MQYVPNITILDIIPLQFENKVTIFVYFKVTSHHVLLHYDEQIGQWNSHGRVYVCVLSFIQSCMIYYYF